MLVSSVAILALLVAGCSTEAGGSDNSSRVSVSSESAQASAVIITDAWAQAADTGSTGVFGNIKNTSAKTVRIVEATSPIAGSVEMHEMTSDDDEKNVRRQLSDGLVIEPNDTALLGPTRDHLMLIDLTRPLAARTTATVTLVFDDGSTMQFEAESKVYRAGSDANETDR